MLVPAIRRYTTRQCVLEWLLKPYVSMCVNINGLLNHLAKSVAFRKLLYISVTPVSPNRNV